MTVSGFVIGEVKTVSNRSQDGALTRDWISMFGFEYHKDEDNFVPDYLWRTLVADRGPRGTLAHLWYH
jgi:hypothetical protein